MPEGVSKTPSGAVTFSLQARDTTKETKMIKLTDQEILDQRETASDRDAWFDQN